MRKGKVYFVGAGPGDPGLITIKGIDVIKQAEVILYDRLANAKILESAPSGCELIYCGKLPDRHIMRQDRINSTLVKKALEGKLVVRLKGGDPGVFGRVGEEAEAIAEQGISYEMIPGITSGIAAPLYAGIPVTHRDFGKSFAIVTAHDKSKDGHPQLEWRSLATGIDTIAFYMGISNLPFICKKLMENGKPLETPVVLIQWGTFGRQKTLEGTLATITQKAEAERFTNPAITLVGDIISLRTKLNWFEEKPLFGRQILLVRTGTDESMIAKELAQQGADVIEFPKWFRKKVKVDSNILKNIALYEKILFTSPESVNEFFSILGAHRIDIRNVKADLYALSTKSVKMLNKKGLPAELADSPIVEGKLLVVGDSMAFEQYAQLQNGDFYITSLKEIDTYFLPVSKRILEEASINTIIFPSSTSVITFMKGGMLNGVLPSSLLQNAEVVALGEKTAAALNEFGLTPDIITNSPTKEALIESLKKSL